MGVNAVLGNRIGIVFIPSVMRGFPGLNFYTAFDYEVMPFVGVKFTLYVLIFSIFLSVTNVRIALSFLAFLQLNTGFEAASNITPGTIGHDSSFTLSPHSSSLSIHLTKIYRDYLINLTDYLSITTYYEICSHNGAIFDTLYQGSLHPYWTAVIILSTGTSLLYLSPPLKKMHFSGSSGQNSLDPQGCIH